MIPRLTHGLVAGSPKYLDFSGRVSGWQHGISLVLNPGAGGTIQVFTSNSDKAGDGGAGSAAAVWVDSGSGAVSSLTEIVRTAPCEAMKLVATTANGVVEQKG